MSSLQTVFKVTVSTAVPTWDPRGSKRPVETSPSVDAPSSYLDADRLVWDPDVSRALNKRKPLLCGTPTTGRDLLHLCKTDCDSRGPKTEEIFESLSASIRGALTCSRGTGLSVITTDLKRQIRIGSTVPSA